MNTGKIYQELKNIPKTKKWLKRKNYFQWQYGLHKPKTMDCRGLTKEEFMEKNQIDEEEFKELQRWEKTKTYQHLKFVLEMDNFDNNFFNVYEELKRKALQGDFQSAKELLELHNSMENKFSEDEKEEETSKKKRKRKKKSKVEEEPKAKEETKEDDDKPKFDFNI